MLKVVFSAADLARVRFAVSVHSETLGSIRALYAKKDRSLVPWQQYARTRLVREMSPLLDTVGRTGAIPDFLAPEAFSGDNRRTIVARSRKYGGSRTTASLDADGAEPADALPSAPALAAAFTLYQVRCFDGVLPSVHRALRSEVDRQGSRYARLGLSGVLGRLSPHVRWDEPVLYVEGPFSETVHLQGRGIRLVPSVLWPRCGFIHSGYTVPTLVYPISPRPVFVADTAVEPGLHAILGRTRAEIASALLVPASTGEVASRVGVSASTASEHLSALRLAGVIETIRIGRAVEHALTPLGLRLVNG